MLEIDKNFLIKQYVLNSLNFESNESELASALVDLYTNAKINNIELIFSDPVILKRVYAKINPIIETKFGKSRNILYISIAQLCRMSINQMDSIFKMVFILMKYPQIENNERYIFNMGLNILNEERMELYMKRISKEIGKHSEYMKMLRKT